ncbi:MAG TPA: TrmH family RNA methyltransferase [Bacteroidetes bacterium]|nr:TrmH family RNA methyltransferase [Bacteroidota bacterium]
MRKLKLKELGRISVPEFKNSKRLPVVLVMDNIRSAMNVGSFFRTADAFAVEKIYICGISATPPHKEINKTAIGATESMDWKFYKSTRECLTELKDKGYIITGIEQTDQSVMLNEFIPEKDKKHALVFGNEVSGISDDILDLLDLSLEIPQFGTKHSFNVAISGGIVLWHYFLNFNNDHSGLKLKR